MKITFLLPHINISGGTRSVFEMANRLQDRGHEVFVVYPLFPSADGNKWYNFKKFGGRVIRFIKNIRQGNNLDWFDLKVKLIRVPTLAEKYIPKADIIAVAWWSTAFDINSYGADKGAKFYLIRGYMDWGGPQKLINKAYSLPLNKIVCAGWLKDKIEKEFNVPIIDVLPNGINFRLFYLERNNFGCHNPKRIGLLYRGLPLKGIKDALEAFLSAEKKYPGIQLVLFGEEPTAEDAEVIKKIKNVEFHKFPYKDDLRKIYNSLDIFIFPSHSEGFQNPPAEATACGAACIATDVGAILDYTIPGKTALIVPPRQPQKIADALIILLNDENKRQEIAKEGYKYIQQFTWDKTIDKLEQIFIKYS